MDRPCSRAREKSLFGFWHDCREGCYRWVRCAYPEGSAGVRVRLDATASSVDSRLRICGHSGQRLLASLGLV